MSEILKVVAYLQAHWAEIAQAIAAIIGAASIIVRLTPTLKDDNALLGYGAGAQLNFGRLGFRLEAEGYDTDDLEDLYFISAGVTFHL